MPGIATLFIALGAAALAAAAAFVICRVHFARVRASLEVRPVMLLKYSRSMAAGDKIDPRDLIVTRIRKDDGTALGGVVTSDSRDFVVGRRLRRSVRRGQWVLWAHVIAEPPRSPHGFLRPGMVAVPLDLAPQTSPGRLCGPGDRVNVLAEIQVDEKTPPQVFRIIRNVKFLATGSSPGIGPDTKPRPTTDRSYRSIVVEVSREVSLQLVRLLELAEGGVQIEVLPPDAPFDPKKHGIINPDEPILQKLLQPTAQE